MDTAALLLPVCTYSSGATEAGGNRPAKVLKNYRAFSLRNERYQSERINLSKIGTVGGALGLRIYLHETDVGYLASTQRPAM